MFKWSLKTREYVLIKWIPELISDAEKEYAFVLETKDTDTKPKMFDIGMCETLAGTKQIFIITDVIRDDYEMVFKDHKISKKIILENWERGGKGDEKIKILKKEKVKDFLDAKTDEDLYKRIKLKAAVTKRNDC